MSPAQKNYKTGTLAGVRQLNLYYQIWHPTIAARANVVLVHGLGEHIGRYDHVAAAFTQAGYAFWAFDNLGHGRSDGQRGHIERWSDYTENIQRFVALVREQSPETPLFIYGHSLGALMVLTYMLQRPEAICGLVISAPPIQPVGVEKPWLATLAKTFSQVLPRLSLNLGLGGEALSRDSKVVRRALADPLMHSVATLRWGTETMTAIAAARRGAGQLNCPILILHGAADEISDAKGSHELFEALTLTDKTLLVYPGNYHEVHNDLDHEQVFRDILTWLNAHLSACQAKHAV
ncbi:MAG: lysophospholipase [Cyanobacteria bacterium J06632_22]